MRILKGLFLPGCSMARANIFVWIPAPFGPCVAFDIAIAFSIRFAPYVSAIRRLSTDPSLPPRDVMTDGTEMPV